MQKKQKLDGGGGGGGIHIEVLEGTIRDNVRK